MELKLTVETDAGGNGEAFTGPINGYFVNAIFHKPLERGYDSMTMMSVATLGGRVLVEHVGLAFDVGSFMLVHTQPTQLIPTDWIYGERLKISVSGAGANRTGKFVLIILDPTVDKPVD